MPMLLPPALAEALTQRLGGPPHDVRPVGGGDASAAARMKVGPRTYMVKWSADAPAAPAGWPDLFSAEARGLALLAGSGCVRVPTVVAHTAASGACPAFIVLEWIAPPMREDRHRAGAMLGQQLAALHRVTAQGYGLDHHNYCGATLQPNIWHGSWIEFFGQQRLAHQMRMADQRLRLPPSRRRRLEQLIAQLDRWIDERATQPSLIHGDLWGGNWLLGMDGEPVLIDPAVYFADREAELAMCRLFGGFPDSFYRAYDEAWPPAPGRDERVPIYQLYHLLNHLNLFGEQYGGQIDAILRRYVG